MAGNAHAQGNVTKNPQGLSIQFGAAQVELAAATPDALRLSVAYSHQVQPVVSSFLVDTNASDSVAWHMVKTNGMVGIESDAGRLLMNPNNGLWTLQNSRGKTLIPPHKIGNLHETMHSPNQRIQIELGWQRQTPIEVYGCGNGVTNLEQVEAKAHVANGKATIPYYWSKSGYAVLAVTANDNFPASWRGVTNKQSNRECVIWTFPGSRADLYLMPAPSLKDAAGAYARLTGAAPVPPIWTFGYLQSRWGWKNRAYINNTLKHFEALNIPVDAFIFDFEWFTPKPDYSLSSGGSPDYHDFGWNTNLFPDPVEQIAHLKQHGVHFVGIRKPRLGNSALLKMIRAKGWDLQEHFHKKIPARDVDFAIPAFQKWYVKQSANLLQAGVAGWWNDEGEATYTTYFYWNLTERKAMNRYRSGARLWTLNRAFSPGTQRFGAAAWTGDIVSSWKELAVTPANLLNWSLAGEPYSTCDIGGFFGSPSPELMTRWLEAGVFFPIMRTHSEIQYQPHFPWLYGKKALVAMRKAIDLRYRLIPYYYSLAHETFETGIPLMRPLVMEFPHDPRVANLTDEWMMGPSLLAAPILQPGDKRSVYLPPGDWYVFGKNRVLKGGCTIQARATLDKIPVYVRAGTILPLGPVVQHTCQFPGGPLQVQIYPGRDATFTFVEDDGETMNYLKGDVRRTFFKWNNGKQELTWKCNGHYTGTNLFQKLDVVLFGPQKRVAVWHTLGSSGTIKFPTSGQAGHPEVESKGG